MTYLIGVRCDLCGKTVTEPYEGQKHKLPEGWGDLTMHYPVDGPNKQMREVCPACTQALYEGRTVIEAWTDSWDMTVMPVGRGSEADPHRCRGCPECAVIFDSEGIHGHVPDHNSETCRGCEHCKEGIE